MARLSLTLRVVALPTLVASIAVAAPVRAETEGWQDRQSWDWGQHRTSLAEEPAVAPEMPVMSHDHWDDPDAPVRFAGRLPEE